SPLNYQWFRGNTPLSNSANISGATSSNLVLAAVTAADFGSYRVRITNTCGSVQSLAADISLSPATLPVLSDVNLTEGWLRFTVDTKVGFDYMVEYKNALTDPDWNPLTTVTGDGNSQLIYD